VKWRGGVRLAASAVAIFLTPGCGLSSLKKYDSESISPLTVYLYYSFVREAGEAAEFGRTTKLLAGLERRGFERGTFSKGRSVSQKHLGIQLGLKSPPIGGKDEANRAQRDPEMAIFMMPPFRLNPLPLCHSRTLMEHSTTTLSISPVSHLKISIPWVTDVSYICIENRYLLRSGATLPARSTTSRTFLHPISCFSELEIFQLLSGSQCRVDRHGEIAKFNFEGIG